MAGCGIGAAPLRREDARFITGRGRYVADFEAAGQLHCAFVRSPHAHAGVGAIDTTAALAMPGVRAVLTGADMQADGIAAMRALWLVRGVHGAAIEPPRYGLARGKVCHVGDAVALVVADSRAHAEDAAEAVQVDYQALAAVTDALDALQSAAPQLHAVAPGNLCYVFERGDQAGTDAAFAGAAHTTRIEIVNQRLAGCALEPRALLAVPDGDALTLYSSTQVPHHIRMLVAEQLGMPEAGLRVIAPDVGGGFGYKGKYYPEEAVLAWAARRLGAPLRWTATRSESFVSDLQGRGHATTAELALDAQGRFTGLRVRTVVDLGAYASTMGTAVSSAVYSSLLSGMYATPVMHAQVRGVFTNTLPTDAYRGAGRPEACYVLERLIDQAARELGMARTELRRRNLIAARAMPYATCAGPVYDCGDFPRVFERALVLSDHAGFGQRRALASAEGRARGIGIACYVESSGVGPSGFARAGGARVGLAEYAEVTVDAAGRVTAVLGTQNHGQGHQTSLAQIVVSRLGVAFTDIEIVEGDTGRIERGTGTFGSRSIAVGGSALVRACDDLLAQATPVAARLLGTDAGEVTFSPAGGFAAHGRSLGIAEVARAMHATNEDSQGRPGWRGAGEFDPPSFAFSNGVHVVEVEVELDTGQVRIERYSAVDDVGTVVNPMIVEGQLHGGVAQGLGQALKEVCLYDPHTGQLLSGSFLDYGMPRAGDMPGRFEIETDASQPFSHNPLGAKGAGEAGTIAAPAAIVSAVLDALRPHGVTDLAMPLTPARVWAALCQARQTQICST